jgi:hypothetical protein
MPIPKSNTSHPIEIRNISAMQENPQVKMESVVLRIPCSSKTSIATRKKLCERIQCVVIETVRMGIRYRYGSERKYVER